MKIKKINKKFKVKNKQQLRGKGSKTVLISKDNKMK